MLRLMFSFVCTVVAARWMYSEANLVVPDVVPLIDYALERFQIPTHDRWPSLGAVSQPVEQVLSAWDMKFEDPNERGQGGSARERKHAGTTISRRYKSDKIERF